MAFIIKKLQIGHIEYRKGRKIWTNGPNSAGETSVRFEFKHTNPVDIEYVWFNFCAFNKEGDILLGRYNRDDLILYDKVTGPIPANEKRVVCFENMFYNHFINSVEVLEVEVYYTDGTEEVLPYNKISCKKQGCYIATAVYGSYDCPEVWTLRRFRDNILAKTWCGRAFINIYYALSPTLVKWFGESIWFKKMWKRELDRIVFYLKAEGFEDTPYNDKNL